MPIRTFSGSCVASRPTASMTASPALGIVLVRLGIAEINEHAIAHILGDKTAKAADGVGDAAMVGADDLAQVLGIKARRQRRRADQITEHHRQLPPLGLPPAPILPSPVIPGTSAGRGG